MKKCMAIMVAMVLIAALSACRKSGQINITKGPDKIAPSTTPAPMITPAATEMPNTVSPRFQEPDAEVPFDETAEIEGNADSVKALVNGSNVNFRSGPSKESGIIGKLAYGQEVQLLGTEGEWKWVQANNMEGYIFAEFVSLEKKEQVAEAPQAGAPADNISPISITVAIDPGHQAKGNSGHEPIGPGALQTKPKVSSGTQGVVTKVPEYQLTLDISLKLRDELMVRGYEVFMIREVNDVNISNKERALMAADAGANILIRIHADGSQNSNVNGILTLCPTKNNPFVSDLYTQSRELSDEILSAMVMETNAKNRGVSEVDNMSGINWATIPVTIIEMGLMTNPAEDKLMQTEEYQKKLALGIANGIDQYFAKQDE